MGVIVSARNFLVFQGDIESIASKSPKELTAFIEKISGSDEFKEEYEKCRVEMEKAEEDTLFTFNKKKTINAERKQYKEQKEEAERFHKLEGELAEMKKKHMLFQLYHIQRDITTHRKETENDTTELAQLESKKENSKKQLEEKSKKALKNKLEHDKLEKEIRKKKAEFDKSRPDAIKLKEEMDHVNKRLHSSRDSLKKVQKEYEKQQVYPSFPFSLSVDLCNIIDRSKRA
jgi:structural maintenance of chromosome 1